MWDLKIINTDLSLYMAIVDAMERDIKAGILKPGDKIPTHRDLAKKVGVTVTTISRAYKEATKRGLISAIVGDGTYVTSDLGSHPSLVNAAKSQKQFIELGLVAPLYSVEPDISIVMQEIAKKSELNSLMKYTPPQGILKHRIVGSKWIKQFGIDVSPDNIIITAGAQHALICILSSLFKPGDKIATDYLIYPGMKAAAKRCGIQLEAVDMDAEGMLPESLASLCHRHKINGIYTVSRMQNPTNACMSYKRIKQICSIIEEQELILIEDDLYGYLSENKDMTLSYIIPQQSIYISSLSKTFYAGLRVSFVAAPKRYYTRILQAVIDTIWMTSALCAEIACECIESGITEKIIYSRVTEITARYNLFKSIFDEFEYNYQQNSMFIWLKLPDGWTSIDVERIAEKKGLHIVASDKFTVGSIPPIGYIRISLSGADTLEELEQGLTFLKKILNYEEGLDIVIL